MAVGFKVKFYWYQIGSGDFLHAFFSTVAYNLEGSKWGSRFPHIMGKLYYGELPAEEIEDALKEIKEIKRELKEYKSDNVVWDFDDLSKQPPWGQKISKEITDLSNYFVTSDGLDFLSLFIQVLEKARELNLGISIQSI